ncbi:unnamed protein product [Pleuronectes platessa]|uniref:Uncharacterized protein n=1 Tax=Pleuronectes platessa TaxID=8262 RepID=A0A9N7TIF9_PLEPL|nr:unnamed protein product [Pleuronectes platessa]
MEMPPVEKSIKSGGKGAGREEEEEEEEEAEGCRSNRQESTGKKKGSVFPRRDEYKAPSLHTADAESPSICHQLRICSPRLFLPLLSAAKVNGDKQVHQRLDVVAAEQ